MKRNSKKVIPTTAGFIILMVCVATVNAFGGMSVSPLQQWVEVKPGKEASFSITVGNTKRNEKTQPCAINVRVLDFSVSQFGGILFGENYKHGRSAVPWISCETGDIVLQPGESKEIKAKITAPLDADGDYWAAFMVEMGKPSKTQQKGVNVNLRTASGIFVHVARRSYTERGSIIDSNIVLPQFDSNQSLTEEPPEEPNYQKTQEKQVLKINAELKNDGVVAILAKGKANIYSFGNRRIASMSLYSQRRQVLPGDVRWFSGVMSQSLPAGQYKLRLVFDSNSEHSRKMTKEMEFSISDELASRWLQNFKTEPVKAVEVRPEELKLNLTPGRFTSATCLVVNRSPSTISVSSKLRSEGLKKDWVELKSGNFVLAPNARQNVICYIRIPKDVKPGEYGGTLEMEVERSGLTERSGNNTKELYKIPINVKVGK